MTKDQPKILVVEDEPDVCNSLQSYLGRRGFLVSTTPSGTEALSIIKASQPNIVLLDLKLSGINGKEVLQTLRQYDNKTHVIVITGEFLKDEEIGSICSLGVTAYLNKPILLEELEKIIAGILGKKLPSRISIKPTKPQEPQDVSLGSIAHELSNLLGVIRNKCENFTLNIEDGIYKDKPDKELVKMALEIMNVAIKTVDRATEVVQKVSNLVLRKVK